jgi:hypothetical protein
MTYSISASGTKVEVVESIDRDIGPHAPAVAEALKLLITSGLTGDMVSITASGYDSSCSLHVTSSQST